MHWDNASREGAKLMLMADGSPIQTKQSTLTTCDVMMFSLVQLKFLFIWSEHLPFSPWYQPVTWWTLAFCMVQPFLLMPSWTLNCTCVVRMVEIAVFRSNDACVHHFLVPCLSKMRFCRSSSLAKSVFFLLFNQLLHHLCSSVLISISVTTVSLSQHTNTVLSKPTRCPLSSFI